MAAVNTVCVCLLHFFFNLAVLYHEQCTMQFPSAILMRSSAHLFVYLPTFLFLNANRWMITFLLFFFFIHNGYICIYERICYRPYWTSAVPYIFGHVTWRNLWNSIYCDFGYGPTVKVVQYGSLYHVLSNVQWAAHQPTPMRQNFTMALEPYRIVNMVENRSNIFHS